MLDDLWKTGWDAGAMVCCMVTCVWLTDRHIATAASQGALGTGGLLPKRTRLRGTYSNGSFWSRRDELLPQVCIKICMRRARANYGLERSLFLCYCPVAVPS